MWSVIVMAVTAEHADSRITELQFSSGGMALD